MPTVFVTFVRSPTRPNEELHEDVKRPLVFVDVI